MRLRATLRQAGAARYLRPGRRLGRPDPRRPGRPARPAGRARLSPTPPPQLDAGAPGARRWPRLAGGLRAAGVRRGTPSPGSSPTGSRRSCCSGPAGGSGRWPCPSTTRPARPRWRPWSTSCGRRLVLAGAGAPPRGTARAPSPWVPAARSWDALLGGTPVRDGAVPGRPTWPWPCSPPARPVSPRRCSTPTADWPTRPAPWLPPTGSARPTPCLMPAPLAHISGLLSGVLLPAGGRACARC